VPESILYYKFQLKTQIELLASTLYDKLKEQHEIKKKSFEDQYAMSKKIYSEVQ
jgi:hypothetical protein